MRHSEYLNYRWASCECGLFKNCSVYKLIILDVVPIYKRLGNSGGDESEPDAVLPVPCGGHAQLQHRSGNWHAPLGSNTP